MQPLAPFTPTTSGEPGRLFVFAPHADDEILGAGGAMALAARAGWDVTVVFGTVAGYQSKSIDMTASTTDRMAEALGALDVLGVKNHHVLFDDSHHLRLDGMPLAELVSRIEGLMAKSPPHLVIAPSRAHHHQDHQHMADACLSAMRPMPQCLLPFVPTVWTYGGTTFGWGPNADELRPNVFVDITSVFDQKMKSLMQYKSQICEPPHSRSVQGITAWHVAWGTLAGVQYAEAFECLRWVV